MREKSDGVAATARARRRLSGSVFLGHVSVGGRSRARRTHTLIGCPQCTWQGRSSRTSAVCRRRRSRIELRGTGGRGGLVGGLVTGLVRRRVTMVGQKAAVSSGYGMVGLESGERYG